MALRVDLADPRDELLERAAAQREARVNHDDDLDARSTRQVGDELEGRREHRFSTLEYDLRAHAVLHPRSLGPRTQPAGLHDLPLVAPVDAERLTPQRLVHTHLALELLTTTVLR